MGKKSPFISVIMPVYNEEKHLEESINSVLNQDYSNLELIIVDDGSTDGSSKIYNKIGKIDSRVLIKKQKNQGLSAARNEGLKFAKGDYIIFIDSDDYWVENCLGAIVNSLKEFNYEIDVVFLKNAVVKEGKDVTEFWGYEFNYKNRIELAQYIFTQKKVAVSACLKVIKKSLFDDGFLYFEEGLLGEDIDWFFKLLLKANSYTTYNGSFYCYRLTKGSISRSYSEKKLKDYSGIIFKWINECNIEKFESYGINKKYLYYMIGYQYEILLSTLFNYSEKTREIYFEKLEKIFWLEKYRNTPRSKLIKLLNRILGFEKTCKILNVYLNYR